MTRTLVKVLPDYDVRYTKFKNGDFCYISDCIVDANGEVVAILSRQGDGIMGTLPVHFLKEHRP